ncbi:chromosome partitioning protein, partial [bacterium LRH843]|nr:chromosome partitioning protein [bacterium LRH843]
YKRLQEEFSYKHEDLADVLGKSRSHISNTLRILSLPDPVKTLVDDGELSMGHARVLAGLPHPEELAETIVKKKLNVR